MNDDDPAAIPAATLILFRDRAAGDAELLFVERSSAMSFAPGAIVFPGGRVDPGDVALAGTIVAAPDDAAARIAAIRETIEEAGIAIGTGPLDVERVRHDLLAGTILTDALGPGAGTLDLDTLVPFARWRPAHRPTRVFDTRFYLARAPAGVVASVDGRENVRLFWATAADILADADAGRVSIIYPTRCNLERLARLPTFAAACADARTHPVQLIAPFIEWHDGVEQLCIPRGLGYPVLCRPLSSAERG